MEAQWRSKKLFKVFKDLKLSSNIVEKAVGRNENCEKM